jgi:putative ABC transport system permease protein
MFRNILAATLRNLLRNRLYAAISIGGLAIGMAAVILTGLYVRDELSFDSFIPGHDKAYVMIWELDMPGRPPIVDEESQPYVARLMKADFKEVQASARLLLSGERVGMRHGNAEGLDSIGWADADLFNILRLPALAGDPVAALSRPDGVVITRSIARKYFGQDAPIGQILEVNRAVPLRVGAVLYDLPSNSHLDYKIFASSLAPRSVLAGEDRDGVVRGNLNNNVRTYLKLADDGVAARLTAAMPGFIERHMAGPDGNLPLGLKGAFTVIPLKDLHLYPLRGTALLNPGAHGEASSLAALSLIAGLILALACINFVNLMTGRAARRAVEVGVRKSSGASRRHLVVQFIGEALVYAVLALLLALALAELALPPLRALVDRPLTLNYVSDPGLVAALVGLAAGVGALTGVYPALVLSAFRPAKVLKGDLPRTSGSAAVRSGLTTLQFAVLIGLVLAATVIGLQTRYAMNQGLNLDKARVLTLDINRPRRAGETGPPVLCRDGFAEAVRRIPGVLGAACSSGSALDMGDYNRTMQTPAGPRNFGVAPVDHGFFELYGVKPLAGRLFSLEHPEDEIRTESSPKTMVINARAARVLGFASPEQAVGRIVRSQARSSWDAIQIVGVVPDFAFDLTHGEVRPKVYYIRTTQLEYLQVKLSGVDTPGVLKAIDAQWRAFDNARPAQWTFVDDYLQGIYAASIRQGRLLDGLCVVAVLLAGLGLFGLASFTAERRTKEIGVRKVMGASRRDVAQLLLWSFGKPVLWANVLAWPLAWWSLHRWLEGFGRHIALEPWMFLAAAAAALAVALATVLAHTLRVAAARPVGALRYE